MSDDRTADAAGELQFDRVITDSPASGSSDRPAVVCLACHTAIETQYYDINGKAFCRRCRDTIESEAETPRGIAPFVSASLYGLGGGIFGALLNYAVIAIAHLEVGIVAILIGYMVGYAVRIGAHGRGGRRFQILAVALTYASVALAYTPLAFGEAVAANRRVENARPTNNASTPPSEIKHSPTPRPTAASLLRAMAFILAFIAGLPVLVVFGSFPSGVISAFIIFIGMRQAWRMTGAPWLQILGPYTVGSAPASGTA